MFSVESVNKVMSIENSSLIFALPLQDLSGAAIDRSVNRDNGTVDGATQNNDRTDKGAPAYTFDGINDGIDIDTPASNCGVYKEGTIFVSARISSAPVWTDSTNRDILHIRNGADNTVRIRRATGNNDLNLRIEASNELHSELIDTGGILTWFTLAIAWQDSDGDGGVFFYYNGAQDSTSTLTSVWDAAAPVNQGGLGYTAPHDSAFWAGSIGPCYAWNKRLTGAQIALADKFMRG
jgi:hypothetical protein